MPLVGKPTSKQLQQTSKIWTYLSIPGLTLGTNYSEYTHNRGKVCIDLKECTRLFTNASKNDRIGICEFVKANATHKIANTVKYWYLVEIRQLDTGRKFLAAGYKLYEPGLTLAQIKKIIELKE